MNFWTGLILGIIIGWLVEWIIDWLFWRRDVAVEGDDALIAAQRATELDLECQEKLAAVELDYHERLAAVEAEWRERLNLNEHQWQSQFAAVDADRETLRAQLDVAAEAEVVAETLPLMRQSSTNSPSMSWSLMKASSPLTPTRTFPLPTSWARPSGQ